MDKTTPPLLRRLIDAVAEIDRRRMYGRKLSGLAVVVLERHKPEGVLGYTMRCEGHFDAHEEEFDWPCDEVEALAEVLGVPL